MQMLRITQCRDPLMWYASLVGELVPYCGNWREAYKSLEPAGFLNRVEFADAEIVTINQDGTVTPNVELTGPRSVPTTETGGCCGSGSA